ncbi:Outer membrane efflux protein [Trichlorobacter ammonificans]|uniref:Outer membrane efflux protein n=2 Tax=Trichlorobacter ammonificans TaxID=2916410 RepID=A0ABN8HG10_9BACT|nr:Outer membrane efflux protein [Trichlorobacter ammonificans]
MKQMILKAMDLMMADYYGEPPATFTVARNKRFSSVCLRALCAALILLGCSFVTPQALAAPQVLTLDDCLRIAAEKNRDIQKAREYAAYVQGRYVEERAAALPQLALNGGFGYARDESSRQMYGGKAPLQSSRSVDLTLGQPLFTWGKIGAAIRAAEVGLKTADEQLRLYRQGALRDVSVAFYDLLLARELHRLAEENLAQKKRHQEEARRKFATGVATDYDVLAADVEVENAAPDLIRAANTVRTGLDRLRFLLALDEEDVDVAGSLAAEPVSAPAFEEARAQALEKRPELGDQRLRIGIYGELVTIAEAENKPRLDLKGAAGWHQQELRDMTPSGRSEGLAWSAGVYLSFPFFDGLKSSGRTAQARSDLRTKQIEELKLRDSIALDVRTARNALVEAADVMQAVKSTVRQAQRLLQMAEKGFEYGVKTRLEVDDAQTSLLRAQTNLARASRDYHAARTNLQWSMGVLGEEAVQGVSVAISQKP